MRNCLFAFVAIVTLILSSVSTSAADLNGKWRGDMKTPNGENLEINSTSTWMARS